MSGATDTAREIYMTGLRNQHAVENEAVSLLNRQIERTETYPELVERMRLHVQESEGQLRRLEELLHAFGTSHSGFKDTVASIGANLAALGQSMAPDEIIKNSLANFAFENDEIASYKALLVLADASGHRAAAVAARGAGHGAVHRQPPEGHDAEVPRAQERGDDGGGVTATPGAI